MASTQAGIYFNDQALKNDLAGTLKGSVLFAQTSVIPSRASALADDVQPRLVSQRTALVLFKPISKTQLAAGITVQVRDGQARTLFSGALNPPSALPDVADGGVTSAGVKIAYGQDFWSMSIPWQHVIPGISLHFAAGSDAGSYANVDVGAPGELLLHTIDLGLLTEHRGIFATTFSDELHRQYFQQTPCSRMVVNHYEPVHLQEIMLPDGTLYRDASSCVGADVYYGDLRQRIGKELVSLGINNANYGIHSSPGSGESNLNKHYVAAQITAHTSVARYEQGTVVHGLSGGGSIVTLRGCQGNEFSHELGHNYGLGHDPGGFLGSVHRAAGSVNSTWGWDSDRNVFLANFEKAESGQSNCHGGECQAPFHGHRFERDTMSGGKPHYTGTNQYTLLTPYVLQVVQRFFESKAVFDANATSGFSRWNAATSSMEEWAEFHYADPEQLDEASLAAALEQYRVVEVSMYNGHYKRHTYLPAASTKNKGRGVHVVHQATYEGNLHVNGEVIKLHDGDVLSFESNGASWVQVSDFSFNYVRTPRLRGVAVTTLVGYYDPQGVLPDYLYPALHGAYGYTYDPDREVEIQVGKCHVEIRNAKGQVLKYLLRSTRVNEGQMNRLHINVAQSFAATSITLVRDGQAVLSKDLLKPAGKARFTVNGRR